MSTETQARGWVSDMSQNGYGGTALFVTFKPRLSLLEKLVMDSPHMMPMEPIIGALRPLLSARAAEQAVCDCSLRRCARRQARLLLGKCGSSTGGGLQPRPGCVLKQTKRELPASGVPARSMEWALTRLVEGSQALGTVRCGTGSYCKFFQEFRNCHRQLQREAPHHKKLPPRGADQN